MHIAQCTVVPLLLLYYHYYKYLPIIVHEMKILSTKNKRCGNLVECQGLNSTSTSTSHSYYYYSYYY